MSVLRKAKTSVNPKSAGLQSVPADGRFDIKASALSALGEEPDEFFEALAQGDMDAVREQIIFNVLGVTPEAERIALRKEIEALDWSGIQAWAQASAMKLTRAVAALRNPVRRGKFPEQWNQEPREWLAEGLVPLHGHGAFYGPSHHGKTTAILDLAVATCTGTPFMGQRVKRGSVLYYTRECFEDFKDHYNAAWKTAAGSAIIKWGELTRPKPSAQSENASAGRAAAKSKAVEGNGESTVENAVREEPGISQAALHRKTGIALGSLQRLLAKLEKSGKITRDQNKGYHPVETSPNQ